MSKLIAVVGATGRQGGGLVRAIQADNTGEFRARALTRDPGSAKARDLALLYGAEVVQADADDPASLRRAFEGAYGAFCVTNFWGHFSVEKEMAQAQAMAGAAKAASLRHVVWSTLEDTRQWVPLDDGRLPTLHGKYKVPHFDGKGASNAFFTQAGVPATFVLTSFYYDNFISIGMGPRKGADGVWEISLPMADKKLPMIAAEDIGRGALGVFREELIGKTVGIAGDHLTGAQIAAAFSRHLEREVRYNYVRPEIYRTLGFPGAEDLANMFQFKRDFNDYFCAARSLAFSRALNPALECFDKWLGINKGRIPLETSETRTLVGSA